MYLIENRRQSKMNAFLETLKFVFDRKYFPFSYFKTLFSKNCKKKNSEEYIRFIFTYDC